MNALDIVTAVLVLSGSTLALTAAIGVVRFPDTLSRMHAATKPQVLGLLLVLAGAAIRLRGNVDVGMLILTGMFTLITAPVVAHRVGQLAYREQNIHDQLTKDELHEYAEGGTKMARTDDESWDITESVGATALGVAWARSQEATSDCPLFTDPYAEVFVDAAIARGWQLPPAHMIERIRAISGYAGSRTKWFDEFFIAAGAGGIDQAVILAAGLDARAWRLPWNDGSVVYEIDQPKVLAFKTEALRAHGAVPAARYVAVPVDLRHDWPKALREAGFDSGEPTAWAAEGLLPYLPADGQDLLFERIDELSAAGSRVAVESFGAAFFDPEYLASRRERVRQMREQAGVTGSARHPGSVVQRVSQGSQRLVVGPWLAGVSGRCGRADEAVRTIHD